MIRKTLGVLSCVAALVAAGCSNVHRVGAVYRPTTYYVPGQNYETCTAQGAQRYLTSPWTYEALASGSHNYTPLQYEELNTNGTEAPTAPGSAYGVTLPTLPTYVLGSTQAIVTIVAPGGSGGGLFTFLEGGNYPSGWTAQMTSGQVVVGGSGTISGAYYPSPALNEGGGNSSDFEAGNNHWNNVMGYGQVASSITSSTTFTASDLNGGYGVDQVTFADGTTVHVTSISGTTITLASAITEAAGTNFWLTSDTQNGYSGQFMGTASTAAPQGATSVTVSPDLLTSTLMFVPYEQLQLGGTLPDGTPYSQTVTLSGSYVPGSDTLTLLQPLAQPVPVNAPVMYGQQAGDVTIEYLNVFNGPSSNNPIMDAAAGWTVSHNWLHDTYGSVAAYGEGLAGGSTQYDSIEYNCFQRLGQYAVNPGGARNVFDYNEVTATPYRPDLSGNGQTGIAKFWATTNNDVVDNAFLADSGSLWFDNGNTGQLVQGNYFFNSGGVENETGWNSQYVGNLFQDESSGVDLNDSGGWDIPGSRYNNAITVKGNIFQNVMTPVDIWGASGRSCLNSGEAIANGESSAYCSGGFPQSPQNATYFSHVQDTVTGSALKTVEAQTCTSASPCGAPGNLLLLNSAPAISDWIGLTGPVTTTATQAVDVATTSTLTVASIAGFPSTGQVEVSTSGGSLYGATGAVLAYTGTTTGELTGVSLVSGTGTTVNGGAVVEVQPYHVVANGTAGTVDCPGGNCTNNAQVEVSPSITSGTIGAGTVVYATGTCPYYVTAAATPASPMAPTMADGTAYSYYDGCMWEDRNISVTDNNYVQDNSINGASYPVPFYADFISGTGTFASQGSVFTSIPLVWPLPVAMAAGTSLTLYWGGGASAQTVVLSQAASVGAGLVSVDAVANGNIPKGAVVDFHNNGWRWSCTTGPSGNCGHIVTGYQAPAGNGAPWTTWTLANSMMSNASFSGALADLNSSTSPLVGGSSGVTPGNGDPPYNLLFANNVYTGTYTFNAYAQAATCPVTWSGTALQYGGSGTNACNNLTLAQWQQYWGQDAGSVTR